MRKAIVLLTFLLLLSGCANTESLPESNLPDTSSVSGQTANTDPTAEPEIADPPTETDSAFEAEPPQKSAEQERLERLILDTRGTDPIPQFTELAYPPESYALFPMLFGDFDRDGKEELFAVFGAQSGYENAVAGEVWFACGDNAKRLDSGEEMPLWNIGAFRVLDEENALVAYSYIAATYRTDRIWKVGGSDVQKTEIDGFARMDFKPSEYGGFSAENSTYDAVYGSGGHTWKSYWCYYDAENNKMVQYDAHEITEEELLAYSGGAEALDGVLSDELNEIQNILLFDNGVICINYTHETYANFFRCYDTAGGALKDITPEENNGVYLSRFPEENG
ncbi:MAG: hypothetical protein ACI4J8_03565 [Oscillospiraceae bacterium]